MEVKIPNSVLCPICSLLMSQNRRPTVFFPCGHTICADCFDEEVKTRNVCPLCQTTIERTAVNLSVLEFVNWLIESGHQIPESIDPPRSVTAGARTMEDVLNQKPPNELCEFAQTGKEFLSKDVWSCRTCGLEFPHKCICSVCARNCHRGHDLVHNGLIASFYCDCPTLYHMDSNKNNCRCCPQSDEMCTSLFTGDPQNQREYICNSCNVSKLCENCAEKCHANHDVKYVTDTPFLCQCSSNTCKCGNSFRLDRCTFMYSGKTPFLQKIFLCTTCGMTSEKQGICEACSIKCHAGHSLTFLRFSKSYCHCDECQRIGNFNGCQLRNLETTCTFIKTGKTQQCQDSWDCLDCNLTNTKCICAVCAKRCHAGHRLVYRGKTRFYCDCGAGAASPCKCCTEAQKNNTIESCTAKFTGEKMVYQQFYHCKTCGLTGNLGCCEACIKKCHSGHEVYEGRLEKCFCDCGTRSRKVNCKCQH